jgi:hypothetical protein
MTGPSSAPRPEHWPRPGAHWERQLASLGETIVDLDDDESPFGWRELPEPPAVNRETRRAAKRAARRKK